LHIEQLALEDFRNYEREEVSFAPGLNLVVGRNAQGKTNLLEAVHCLTGLGSPRGSDATLVRSGAERAVLHAQVVRRERAVRIDIELKPGRGARALVNRTPISGTKALRELVVSVFFGPDELSLVKGSPDGRRRFLDDLVVKLHPVKEPLRREWERTLRQRNALLKTAPRATARSQVMPTLDAWDESFARAGADLTVARLETLAELQPHTRKRYETVAGSGEVALSYASSWLPEEITRDALGDPRTIRPEDVRTALESSIKELRVRELERGLSLAGPQRDDVIVQTSGPAGTGLLDARTYASQGDQRTCALALKLGEHDLLSEALDDEVILLLDDVFSELDPSRRSWLADAVRAMGQTIVSSAEPLGADLIGQSIEVTEGHATVREGNA
jgi:DNA replication and repair protein RecF